MKEKAVNYFKNGYSCSESIVKASIEEGLCPKELLGVATSFSGGMSSGCLCGAVSGAQIVLGYNYGRDNTQGNETLARQKAAEFTQKFKEIHKVTCCKVLSAGLKHGTPECKEHCSKMVGTCAEILEDLTKAKVAQKL